MIGIGCEVGGVWWLVGSVRLVSTPQKEWRGDSLPIFWITLTLHLDMLSYFSLECGDCDLGHPGEEQRLLSILKHSRQKLELTIASCIRSVT